MAGVSVRYDESGNPSYYASVPMGEDSEGAPIYEYVKVPASAVKTETVQVPYDFETGGGGGSYQQYTIPSDVYQKAIDSVTPTAIPKNYTRPEDVQKSGAFTTQPGAGENVNDFSHGQLGNIYDAINSGAYKINEDKTKMFTPYGTYSLRSIGNGLYDIPIGAKSGAYNVAIGVDDKGQAIFNKNFLDNGAVRYVGGSPGGGLTSLVRDIGPVGNIALAVATGGMSIPEQIAAQTAYNMAGGAKFEDALARGALTAGINQGIGSLTGGANLGSTNPADYAGLGSGLGGGEFYDSLGVGADDIMTSIGGAGQMGGVPTGGIGDLAGTDDIMTSIGGVGQMGGSLPTTEFPDGAGVSDLSALGEPTTGIYPGEGVPSGIPAWDNAYVAAGGTFDPAYVVADDVAAQQAAANAVVPAGAGAGVADLAGTTAGAAGAGIGLADALKYAGLAGLASTLLGGGKTAGGGGGGGPDQTPVGAGLSPDYKPYRYQPYAAGGITALAGGGYNLGGYSDGGRLLRGPGDGVSDDIPASIGGKQPARLADGEFVIPARIVSEIGNGSTDAGARKLYEMMDRVQSARRKTMGKKQFAKDTKADKYFPA